MGIVGIVYHWCASRYNQTFSDYHYCIQYNPKTQKANVVKTCESDDELKAHTWQRNTGRIGIALCCAYNATTNDLGDYPPTPQQIEVAAALGGDLIKQYNIPATEVKTHAEWAIIDGYGPYSGDPETRWDLWVDNWQGKGKNLSAVIRDKALWYAKGNKPVEQIDIQGLIIKYAEKYDLDTEYITAIIQQESAFNPNAISSSGAKGLMQLLPGTFKECLKGAKLPFDADIFNPDINIHCGCYYLDFLAKRIATTDLIYHAVSMAYNQGAGAMERGETPVKGLDYANEVIIRYNKLKS